MATGIFRTLENGVNVKITKFLYRNLVLVQVIQAAVLQTLTTRHPVCSVQGEAMHQDQISSTAS